MESSFSGMQVLQAAHPTPSALLKSCARMKDLRKGTRVHADLLRGGLLGKCSSVADSLVIMYAKCGAVSKAKELLDELLVRNVFAWTAIILEYVQLGQSHNALSCFEHMQREGISPSAVTFSGILKACGIAGACDKGERIHDEIAKQGLLGDDIVLGTALVDMYAKCGALEKAQSVLEELPTQDVYAWTALIAGYVQRGQNQDALDCFGQMRCKGLSPDAATFACMLKACASIGALDKGRQIHDEIAKKRLLVKSVVLGNALVDMYAKCGALAKAQEVLENLPIRDIVSWNALITGYTEQSQGDYALNCFDRMQHEGFSPDAVTFIGILKACGNIGAADKGEQIHARQELPGNDIVLGTALVDMYAKCGSLMKAQHVLKRLAVWDAASCNALIAGYAQQGQSQDALNFFEQMQQKGISPNAFTFCCVLNACRHSGLVDEGQMYFGNMSAKYSVEPGSEHYACMVDLFGRAGHFDKAVAVINKMPCSDYCAVWHALLGACQKWQDVNIGRWAFEHAVQLDRSDASAYVTMANIYASVGMQEAAEIIEAMRVENKAWKKRGCNLRVRMIGNAQLNFGWDPGIQNMRTGSDFKLKDNACSGSWQVNSPSLN